MKFFLFTLKLMFLTLWLAGIGSQAQTAELSGTIIDRQENTPLPRANLILLHQHSNKLIDATFTNDQGEYRFVGIKPDTVRLIIQYVGYDEASFLLALKAGEGKKLNVKLTLAPYDLNAVVVTAPWQMNREVTESSSITILDESDIEAEVSLSPVSSLNKVAGMDLARTGADNYEIAVRGFNDFLSTSTHVMTDFRHAAIPSIGGNFFQVMPFSQIDIDRIEVVRGPGSSLYGSGADAGVIHFVTKDPFNHPGTTIMLAGGERESMQGGLRQAGVLFGDKIGYKVVANHAAYREWGFDPNDPQDQEILADELVPRQDHNEKTNVYGSIEYRINPQSSVILNGGFNRVRSHIITRFATTRLEEFVNSFINLQIRSGNYFAQANLSRNDLKSGFFYTAPNTVLRENSTVARVQQQYNIVLPGNRGRFILGGDLGVLTPKTSGTINGRFETEDELIEVGSYVQSNFSFAEFLNLSLSMRVDYDNINKTFNTGPRGGLIFKLNKKNYLRAFYSKTYSPISSLDIFMDLLSVEGIGSAFDPLTLRIMGNPHGFHYQRNPAYRDIAGSDLVASSINPAAFGAPQPVGTPIAPVYDAFYGQLIQSGLTLPGFSEAQSQAILAAVNPANAPVAGFSRGQLAVPNGVSGDFRYLDTVEDLERVRPTFNETYELGFRGTVADRFIFSADGYYSTRENFLGHLEIITPFVFVPQVKTDFEAAVAAAYANNPGLQALGLSAEEIRALAGMMAQLADANGALSRLERTPVAIVQPLENAAPGELLTTTVNYGKIEYWGFDLAWQYFANSRLDFFGNFSLINKDLFDDEALHEPGSGRVLTLNAPKIKTRGGFNYRIPRGISFNAALRYSDGFPMISGIYVGQVDPYFLVDLGMGYDLSRIISGMKLDVQAANVLNKLHREFVGAPKIGRLVMGRLIWQF